MDRAEKKVEKFSESSVKGLSETKSSMKDLFSAMNLSGSAVAKLFPELRGPLQWLIKDIIVLKKLFNDISKTQVKKPIKEENKKVDKTLRENKNDEIKKSPKDFKEVIKKNRTKKVVKNEKLTVSEVTKEIQSKVYIKEKPNIKKLNKAPINQRASTKKPHKIYIKEKSNTLEQHKVYIREKSNIIEQHKDKQNKIRKIFKNKDIDISPKGIVNGIKSLKNTTKSLAVDGVKGIKAFASTTVGAFALVGVASVGVIVGLKKIVKGIGELAKQDIEYEKLARQLWTTKENARDVDTALKTMGASLEDVRLSPTLLRQFNQLRKDAAQVKMPEDFKNNIKIVQGIGFEIKRFKQFVTIFFRMVGSYILKYCKGPLQEIKNELKKYNNGLIKAIPIAAKAIGTVLGVILRILIMIGKVLAIPCKIIFAIGRFILDLIEKIPGSAKKIIKIVALIGAAILAGPIGLILLAIAILDDLFTFLRGGKSVIGSVIDYLKQKALKSLSKIIDKFGQLKSKFKKGMASLKDDWNSYLDKAIKVLEAIKEKAKTVWKNIKEWSKGAWEKTKDFTANLVSKVEVYDKNYANTSVPAQYTNQTNNKSTTANSNNKIKNDNIFNIYGTEAKATANEVKRSVSGITTRALQGVIQ